MSPAGLRVETPLTAFPTAPATPLWLQKEAILWIAIAVWCFLPSHFVQVWTLAGIPFRITEVVLLVTAAIYGLGYILTPRVSTRDRSWASGLLAALGVVLGYAAISLLWSGLGWNAGLAMAATLPLTGASAGLAYVLIAPRPAAAVHAFLWRLTLCLWLVGLVYSAQSLFSLGLRTAIAQSSAEFGIDRVRGPLFESSTGYFILLPALAFAAQEALDRRISRPVGLVIIFSLAVTIMGLGSRGGLAMLGCFVLISAFTMKRAKALTFVAVIAVCGFGAWSVVFSKATTTRLEGLGSNEGRIDTYETAWHMLRERPLLETLTGSGYGSEWPWNATELEVGADDIYARGQFTRLTPYGLLLYHSHSTPLVLIIELGMVGSVFLWKLGKVLVKATARCAALKRYPIFASGVVAASLSMFMDLYLFRRPTRDIFWWLFLFGLLALIRTEDSAGAEATPRI